MANILKMGRLNAAFLVSEARGTRSRTAGVIVASAAIEAGTVLGQRTAGSASASAKAGNTGNATVGAVTVGDSAVTGMYSVVFTSATTFRVLAPSGAEVATGTAGAATTGGGHIGFTITAGATAMEAGDGFNINVTATKGAFAPLNLSASDGTQTTAGILMFGVEAGTSEATVIVRDAEVQESELGYPATATAAQKLTIQTALKGLGIIVR